MDIVLWMAEVILSLVLWKPTLATFVIAGFFGSNYPYHLARIILRFLVWVVCKNPVLDIFISSVPCTDQNIVFNLKFTITLLQTLKCST